MRLLLDTHVLLWAAITPDRLSQAARGLIEDGANDLMFSVVSIWEIAIKHSLGRTDFDVEPGRFRDELLAAGYGELTVNGAHPVAVVSLPLLHRDPFDRLLLAQAIVEKATFVTADPVMKRYSGPVRLV
jgi:PIN domain nuclease of toxin-antitoxin system